MAGRRHVILGDGAAGTAAAEALRRLDPAGQITVVSEDPHPPYFRAALTNYLLGELREDQIWAVPPSFYGDLGATRVFARAVSVDADRRAVELASGDAVPFDTLLVATGARPRAAPFERSHLAGVVALRTLQDARRVMDDVVGRRGLRAIVVGGGPLGLELAHALRERGAAVTLMARGDRLMPEALDATASDLVLARLRRGGIEVRLGEEIAAAVEGTSGRVAGAVTRSGQLVACELLAVAIGVTPNVEALEGSGAAIGPRGGVLVDDRLATSVKDVYAAGDVAEHRGGLFQLWEPARRMAQVAASNMAGVAASYAPGAHYFATRLYDLDFAAVGASDVAEGDKVLTAKPSVTGRAAHRRLVIRDGKLRGALMIGERSEGVRRRGRLYKKLIDMGADVSSVAPALLDPGFDLQAWIETRAVVARPPDPAPSRAPAELRGTQRVVLPVAAREERGPTSVVTQVDVHMLSVGLRLPVGEAPALEARIAPAFLEARGRRFALDREVVSVGREPPCSILIDDPEMAPRHAEIVRHEGARWLRDAGSRTGSWINDALVTIPRALRDGDRVRLGATTLVFRGSGPKAESKAMTRTTPDAIWIAVLEIKKGPGVGLTFALRGPEVLVGRDPSSRVRIDDPSVSRRHARLSEIDGRWTITDLESSRGTKRNGKPVAAGEEAPLGEGDALTLGEVVLVFMRRARGGERGS